MRIYRLLLYLYPASFRADYGEEMAAIFQVELRTAHGVALLTLWFAACHEVIMNAPAAHWDILKQDLRYTVRTLNRARGFALTAILVTALGVGANTAAFSVADFVLLRPLPFPDPDALVRLCEGPRDRRRMGLHEPALARQLSRLQGDERVVRGDGRVHRRRGEPGRRRRAAASRDRRRSRPKCCRCSACSRRSDASSMPATGRSQRGGHQLWAVAIAVRAATRRCSGGRSTSMALPTRSSASCRRRSTFPPATSSCGRC